MRPKSGGHEPKIGLAFPDVQIAPTAGVLGNTEYSGINKLSIRYCDARLRPFMGIKHTTAFSNFVISHEFEEKSWV